MWSWKDEFVGYYVHFWLFEYQTIRVNYCLLYTIFQMLEFISSLIILKKHFALLWALILCFLCAIFIRHCKQLTNYLFWNTI